ncbi:MAG: PadR family transcriptional regulator [Gemmatimonadota bacterium]|nr:MAG: PadR family transcriptional regulator [Gemmatimonadota bacterium]
MTKLDDQARALLPLTPAVYHILLALADEDRHGLGIMQDMEERTGGKVLPGPGTLYGTIKRLLEAGLINEARCPDGDRGDPRRRYYRLTRLGRRAASLETDRLAALLRIAQDKQLQRDTG